MKLLEIARKDSYKRGELLLRTIFGAIYIGIPHGIVMGLVSIIASILAGLAFWAILFTGKYPQKWWELEVNFLKWGIRLNATFMNMIEGYPALGLKGEHEQVKVDMTYPAEVSRGSAIIRTLFGALYVGIPHGFCLCFRMIAQQFVSFLAFWSILFKGEYPENLFKFSEGSLRWQMAVQTYMMLLQDEYPKFNGAQE
jgi:hypothetical protein